jgi:hypothetical protein
MVAGIVALAVLLLVAFGYAVTNDDGTHASVATRVALLPVLLVVLVAVAPIMLGMWLHDRDRDEP